MLKDIGQARYDHELNTGYAREESALPADAPFLKEWLGKNGSEQQLASAKT